ncbi:MAG: SDR family NAD(P)-dependent oxidoreductase [Nitrospinota bacterium]|nr:SDR family NAD(P)-dependent oxidoreductase [Nitrospinota bacterium]
MDKRSSISGQLAVITGAAAGIGEAVVNRFVAEGAKIVILDKDVEKGKIFCEKLSSNGADAKFYKCDVTQSNSVDRVFELILNNFGPVQILVNCAGGFVDNPSLEDISPEEWDKVLSLNLMSVYLCTRKVVVSMKKSGYGRIVNVSSQTAREGLAETSLAYGAAKAGVLGFTRRLASELALDGITVNAVAPGVVLSPRVAELHKERLPKLMSEIPMNRPGDAEEIADGIWYLSTPGASYITGVTLDINGGRYMT